MILIIDYGSQFTKLIARRVREFKVYSEIIPYHGIKKFKEWEKVEGIILSGGPASVYEKGAPRFATEVLNGQIPILGICYGMQLLVQYFGGRVASSKTREYGSSELNEWGDVPLLKGIQPSQNQIWMSHGDSVAELPRDFKVICQTQNGVIAGIKHNKFDYYGVQFHPEVTHTLAGKEIIQNFLFSICNAKPSWDLGNFLNQEIDNIRTQVKGEKVICGVSGGVDSTVTALMIHEAIQNNLISIFINTGLLRKNEETEIKKVFKDNYQIKLHYVDASALFLKRLKGVKDPERKRKIIGKTFIEVFEKEAKRFKGVKYLAQGTLYPDRIESVSIKGPSVTIKSHHNVGGLPKQMKFKLIEPLKELFKDEVRNLGSLLKMRREDIQRHPFPGPGLAIRIIGDVNPLDLKLLKEADQIYIQALKDHQLYDKIWQAFAVLLPVKTVGVMGDGRTYEKVIALRAVTSVDGMTADWFAFEAKFLNFISSKIINQVKGINRVVLDISTKPPATIEWE